MGTILYGQQITTLRARFVCGVANNQLATDADGEQLRARELIAKNQ